MVGPPFHGRRCQCDLERVAYDPGDRVPSCARLYSDGKRRALRSIANGKTFFHLEEIMTTEDAGKHRGNSP